MAGFNYELGRSNNMVAAEERGMITLGRWGRRYGVSARAVQEVMRPTEAHHTGTGRRGKSRLTYVIEAATTPTAEQLAAMRAWDAGQRPVVQGWFTSWRKDYSGPYGRRRNVPVLAVYRGDVASAPKGLVELSDPDFAAAQALAGRDLVAYARDWREVRA